jgi:hypothetical protein
VEHKWFSQSLPQTLQTAVMLLYLLAALTLIEGVVFGGVGLFLLLAVAPQVAGGFGIANDSKAGYRIAIVFTVLPAAWMVYLIVRYHTVNFGVVLTLMTYVALSALLLHQQSREYARIWFR